MTARKQTLALVSKRYFYYYLIMETKDAATLLASLAQPTRLDVFRALVVAGSSGLAAGTLAEHLGVSEARSVAASFVSIIK